MRRKWRRRIGGRKERVKHPAAASATFESRPSEQSTRLQLYKEAQERNQELRNEWLARLAGWQANQPVFVDESAANEHTADRKTGWAPIGKKARRAISGQCSRRWSILPAYMTEGYTVWGIIQSPFTKELFNAFIIEKLLSTTVQSPSRTKVCDYHG